MCSRRYPKTTGRRHCKARKGRTQVGCWERFTKQRRGAGPGLRTEPQGSSFLAWEERGGSGEVGLPQPQQLLSGAQVQRVSDLSKAGPPPPPKQLYLPRAAGPDPGLGQTWEGRGMGSCSCCRMPFPPGSGPPLAAPHPPAALQSCLQKTQP